MTPERAKWWDSLPAEEKRVRKSIKGLLFGLGACKESLSEFKTLPRKQEKIKQLKTCCKVAKQAIKALRKQIAMRPYVMKTTIDDFEKCPNCKVRTIRYLPCCACCGQKLRWD